MKNLKLEFEQCDKIKIFEIEVIDKRTQETEYIIFDIDIDKNSFVASHESLTVKQEKSKKIAMLKMKIDKDFSLDEILQELYEMCINAICISDFFELTD